MKEWIKALQANAIFLKVGLSLLTNKYTGVYEKYIIVLLSELS